MTKITIRRVGPVHTASVKTEAPARVARLFAGLAARGRGTGAGLVFLSGGLAGGVDTVAERLSELRTRLPILVATGAGVLTERGEIERESAAAMMFWQGGESELVIEGGGAADEIANALATRLGPLLRTGARTALVLLKPDGVGPRTLEPFQALSGSESVFGGGCLSGLPVLGVQPNGGVERGDGAALVIAGQGKPSIASSAACRLLMPPRSISETRGPMVMRIEGERALDVLGAVASRAENGPLILTALFDEEDESGVHLVRPIQGVDPMLGGLLVSDEVRPGRRIAFAVRDAEAARLGLEAETRRLEQSTAGAAPRFGVYMNCAGRGSALYASEDVDTRIIRARFPNMPWVGMSSSFEIAPYQGRPTLALYAGVLALFAAPS
jgi:small ligand-binding sensory domain FIST